MVRKESLLRVCWELQGKEELAEREKEEREKRVERLEGQQEEEVVEAVETVEVLWMPFLDDGGLFKRIVRRPKRRRGKKTVTAKESV